MMELLKCRICGGEFEEISKDEYKCCHCGQKFVKKTENDIVAKLKAVLKDHDYELASNARLNLWNAMHQKSLYLDECDYYAKALKAYMPSDYYANFAETASTKSDEDISSFLDSSSEEDMKMYADAVLDFLAKLGRKKTFPSAQNYLSRAYSVDSPEYEMYAEKFKTVKLASKPKKVKAPEQTKIFWKVFEEVLTKHGNPFMINTAMSKGEKRPYSTINNESANCSMCLGIDFHTSQKDIRISIYFANIKYRVHYDSLKEHKSEIDKILDYDAIWNEMGTKNKEARRVETTISFDLYDKAAYRNMIERALPVIDKYLDVCRKFLPQVLNLTPKK